MQNYYEFLGIPNFSDIDIVRTAYRNLSKQYHPDNLVNATEDQKQKSSEYQQNLNYIYTYLSNKNNKFIYDIELKKSIVQQHSFQGEVKYNSENDELTNLKNKRFSLRMEIARRELTVLKNAYESEYYKTLIKRKESVTQTISEYKLEKLKIDKYLKALDNDFVFCNEYLLYIGYSMKIEKHFKSVISETKKFHTYSKQLENKIQILTKEIEELEQEISGFPSKDYISKDSEIQRLNKLIFELDEKIKLYEDTLYKK